MNNRIHYIVKDTFSGCVSSKIERMKYFTNEKECLKAITELKKNNNNNHIAYWYDFEWKTELLKKYSWLFKGNFSIELLNSNI